MIHLPQALRPDWPAAPGISALMSTRAGGISQPPFDSLNLRPAALSSPADARLDRPEAITENQRRFAQALGAAPVWLDQVHGAAVLRLTADAARPVTRLPQADASVCTTPGIACTVLVADCLPVLLCSMDGAAVAAAHAGWRGLAAGVIDNTVAALCLAAGCRADQLLAWLGPCIGPAAFEVGADVLLAFGADLRQPEPALFVPGPSQHGSPRWHANLPALARRRLAVLGVRRISGGQLCTVADASRFFSFRRDGRTGPTGRMAAAIAIRG